MSDALCPEGKRCLHAIRSGSLSGMDRHRDSVFTDFRKDRCKVFRREQAFRAGNVNRAHDRSKILFRCLHRLHVQRFIVCSAHAAEDQSDTDLRIGLHAALRTADRCLDNFILRQTAIYGKLRCKADLRIIHTFLCKVFHKLISHTLDRVCSLKDKKRKIKALQIFLQCPAVFRHFHFILYFFRALRRKPDPLFFRKLPDCLRAE